MEDKILIHVDEKGEKHDYNHMVALISFTDDDSYNLKSVIVNGIYTINVRLDKKIHYPFRSQGNYHVLFRSEYGTYFYKGFDGHKGNVFYDSNTVMKGLVDYLNTTISEHKLFFDYELLGAIEKYFTKDDE